MKTINKLILVSILIFYCSMSVFSQSSSNNYQLHQYGFLGGNPNEENPPGSDNFDLTISSVGGIAGDEMSSSGYTSYPGFLFPEGPLIGDTIEDPFIVTFVDSEYTDNGSTVNFNNDYQMPPDFGAPDSNDVVYQFTLESDMIVDVSLLNSLYDTKLAIYIDSSSTPGWVPGPYNYLYYNDDYNSRGEWTKDIPKPRDRVVQSALFGMELVAGTYFAIVDGNNAVGEYQIDINISEPPVYGAISGTVTGSDTGSGIEGAFVTADGYSATTIANGTYTIFNVPASTYDVTASAEAYEPDTLFGIVVEAGVTTDFVDFELTPEVVIPFPLPFVEAWDYGDFGTNNWSFNPELGNWDIATYYGNPEPSAKFDWGPVQTDYSFALVSYSLDGTDIANISLTYDISLSNYLTSTLEQMGVEVYDGSLWTRVANYTNADGDIPWTTETIDISEYAGGNVFKVRFVAYGEDSYSINFWSVDNISVSGFQEEYDISGNICYFSDDDPVPNALLELTGDNTYSTTTAESGDYLFNDIPGGNYISTPSKADDLGGLSGTDASRIARYVALLYEFDCIEMITADVSMNQSISGTDASRVARYVALLITDLNTGGINWVFTPEPIPECNDWPPIVYENTREYSPLDSDLIDENFIGIRLGDVSSNWSPDMRESITDESFEPTEIDAEVNSILRIPVIIDKVSEIEGIDISIAYNPEVLHLTGLTINEVILDNKYYAIETNLKAGKMVIYALKDLITE
ncbi:MAG: carboxypeptidase regulatory-like domain-containing protein, partial [Candidatus Cloacimonetes bacterium]|nr:carboxypeptidase regulatory-like domain-containing protein [Candidatus Cloacimonadota bacterium]